MALNESGTVFAASTDSWRASRAFVRFRTVSRSFIDRLGFTSWRAERNGRLRSSSVTQDISTTFETAAKDTQPSSTTSSTRCPSKLRVCFSFPVYAFLSLQCCLDSSRTVFSPSFPCVSRR
ncbi:hypothetical protein TGP89_261075 [Toxoplasma gondii p89]|uniref:Uncharacterized protein n=1 Tax=Toxoplasma gondii p89 TaxID=943119 RepID=A0A086K5N2_TOXGO|nr:hypothetical protein TGP89_261075 [Toxoplasma gondii p89]